jgi:transposase
MRYELADHEWVIIRPMLPKKPSGVPRVNDRRVLNGIFWVLRTGAPWRDLPAAFGPYTTCYNRAVGAKIWCLSVPCSEISSVFRSGRGQKNRRTRRAVSQVQGIAARIPGMRG